VSHLLIVGAGPGISGATARRFGSEGYQVGLVARGARSVADLVGELEPAGVTARGAVADAADPRALTDAVTDMIALAGPVDVLLYNVSVGRQVAVEDLAPEDLLSDLAAGAVGLQTAMRAVLPGMRERGTGTVLVTGGGAADSPVKTMATLGVQKAAVRALAHVQAHALAPYGVHVATVTVRGFVGEQQQIHPDRVAAVYAELVAETNGPRDDWRTVVDIHP
jgi:NADP-dependent 3-hydroxy acid dehydrogenase YdfG